MSARCRLAAVLDAAPADREPVPGFHGSGHLIGGGKGAGQVRAVLERTAVVELAEYDRRLARLDDLMVDPAEIEWRPKGERPTFVRHLHVHRAKPDDEAGSALTVGAGARVEGRTTSAEPENEEPAEADPDHDVGGAEALQPSNDVPASAPVALLEEDPAETTAPPAWYGEVEPPSSAPAAAGTRPCGVCGVELPAQNRKGVCVACQQLCPDCGGPKAVQAARCRACSHAEPLGPTEEALAIARDLAELPGRVQDLLDQLLTLAKYARDLEDELDHTQAELRTLRRTVAGALARSAS